MYFLVREIKKLENHIRDYAYWDDMGEFGVIKKDKNWIKNNLEPWVRNTFHYDLVALLKENGKIIIKSPFENIPLKILLPKNLTITSGFYITKRGVLVYASSPVFDNYGKKFYHAFLIFGYIIDDSVLKEWEKTLDFGIVIKTKINTYSSDPNIPEISFSSDYCYKDNYLCILTPIDAKNGSFEFKIYKYEDLPSKISLFLQRSFILSLVFILILSILLSNFAISAIFEPLKTFQKNIEDIAEGKYNIELDINRKDEIGELARSFKKMVDKVSEREKELTLARKLAEESSLIDELTGIPNRKFLYQYTEYLIKTKEDFALVFIDLDNFKSINDLLGHSKGDEVLKEVAQWLKKNLREEDKLARYGGDEFCIILLDVNEDKAEEIVKRLYIKFLSENFITGIMIGFSYGISFFPKDGENLDKLLEKADERMYKMKYDESE
ncbi:MAG: diguanylate cyclase [Dictyoglomus sp.]|nr:diguanylate cyclase [Dictyoglomus sp.]MDW8187886.1 diguanylate cyclase [Dictyoglomus sp.]